MVSAPLLLLAYLFGLVSVLPLSMFFLFFATPGPLLPSLFPSVLLMLFLPLLTSRSRPFPVILLLISLLRSYLLLLLISVSL